MSSKSNNSGDVDVDVDFNDQNIDGDDGGDIGDGNHSADAPLNSINTDECWEETPNADRLVSRYGSDLRYCIERRAYYVWDGKRWVWDDFRKVESLAESTLNYDLVRAASIKNKKLREETVKSIKRATNRVPLQNMIHLAKKKVRSVSVNEFDANPWILNCNNGIVNLRTGELLPHTRESMCSKLVPTNYEPGAKCPQFQKFLTRIMGGGPASTEEQNVTSVQLTDCLQRLFGCATTGMFEKILAVLFGVGNNGKTTLLEIARLALGGEEYAGEIQISTLMASGMDSGHNNATSADIAGLKGCRMVTSSEPEEGHHLSVNRVKYLTGGNQVKARFLRENPFTFQPSHTIFLDTNHPPVITNANDAVWNRIKCIPFNVTIPKSEIDPELPAKLRAELTGVLAWMIEGAVLYANCGLYFPPIVYSVTEEYRNKSDHLPSFIADCCDKNPEHAVPVTKLWIAYEQWIISAGEDKLSTADFKQRMLQAGYKYERIWMTTGSKRQQVRVWKGLALRPDAKVSVSFRPSEAT